MINKVELKNFGPIKHLNWHNISNINLIIGKNSTGKTFLLKSLYTAMKTIEEYKRGDNPKSLSDILIDKLIWTFQTDIIGDLVNKEENSLNFSIDFNYKHWNYSFGKETSKQIKSIEYHIDKREDDNSIFLPAKEITSIDKIIFDSRDNKQLFGFDNTYYDLAKAIRLNTQKGRNFPEFANCRKNLKEIIDGKIEFDTTTEKWYYKKGKQKFSIGMTAEGIKKIAIIDILLGNRYLTKDSIIFIDEPESALHPKAISQFLELLSELSESGIQIFMATHSYYVIKRLYLISQKKEKSISGISFDDSHENNFIEFDLIDGIPENSIIEESINLYKEEVDLGWDNE